MYSSVSEAEYQFRRAKAEEDARKAYDRSKPSSETVKPDLPAQPASSGDILSSPSRGGLGGILSRIKDDDILLLAVLFLLFNENKDDDPLIVIILAILLLN